MTALIALLAEIRTVSISKPIAPAAASRDGS
jgi:hypothetical protein